jgi:hypothetical protein
VKITEDMKIELKYCDMIEEEGDDYIQLLKHDLNSNLEEIRKQIETIKFNRFCYQRICNDLENKLSILTLKENNNESAVVKEFEKINNKKYELEIKMAANVKQRNEIDKMNKSNDLLENRLCNLKKEYELFTFSNQIMNRRIKELTIDNMKLQLDINQTIYNLRQKSSITKNIKEKKCHYLNDICNNLLVKIKKQKRCLQIERKTFNKLKNLIYSILNLVSDQDLLNTIIIELTSHLNKN